MTTVEQSKARHLRWSPLVYIASILGMLAVPLVQSAEAASEIASVESSLGLIFTSLAAIGGALCTTVIMLWKKIGELQSQLRDADGRTLLEAKDGSQRIADVVEEFHIRTEDQINRFQVIHEENQRVRQQMMERFSQLVAEIEKAKIGQVERLRRRPTEGGVAGQ